MSSESQFKSLMLQADALFRAERPDYYAGYTRGLRRAHHGDRFGTEAEHELWMSLVDRPDHCSQERGNGYRAGLMAIISNTSPNLPTSTAVHAYLRSHNITGNQAARMMYLSDSRQVRKYTGGSNPRQMDGARWFCLHAHQMLPAETIAEIESAMNAAAESE